jgi:small subunit ribosomal protein S1
MVSPVDPDSTAEDRPEIAVDELAEAAAVQVRGEKPEAALPPAPPPDHSRTEEKKETKGGPQPAGAKVKLREAARTGALVEGKVVAIVRGGYEVDVDGVICLCPFNQIALTPPRDQLVHARQVYTFHVTSYKQRGRRVTLSRRRILEKEARKAERAALREIQPGSDHDGTVASLSDYGAFVDIGHGIQGMVHVSEITHARLVRPADKLAPGDKVRVKVLTTDRRRGRLSLSIKALEGDPWEKLGTSLHPHQIISGRLMRMTEFGAFVEVAPGVDGLIHISEIPAGAREQYEKMATEAAELLVHVLRVDAAKKRISLAPAPADLKAGDVVKLQTLTAGKVIEVTVEKIDKSGVTVRIGKAQTGVIPPNETGTPRGADLAKSFSVGKTLRVQVMRAEKGDRRIRLSLRRADREEERTQIDDYRKSASSGSGSFATLGDFFGKDAKN